VRYIIDDMEFVVELEPEVEQWLDSLTFGNYQRALYKGDLLTDRGPLLDEPHARLIAPGLRELRIPLAHVNMRVSYWFPGGEVAVLMTVWEKKTRKTPPREIERAMKAMAECTGHERAVLVYDRRR
jgi:phage-related protein